MTSLRRAIWRLTNFWDPLLLTCERYLVLLRKGWTRCLTHHRRLVPRRLSLLTLEPRWLLSNLVTNGGFETGTFSGWTQGGNTDSTFVQSGSGNNSTYGAALGPVGSDGTLSQTIATNPGSIYRVSFDLECETGTPNDFTATFANQTLYSGTNLAQFDYTTFTSDVTATGTNSTLQFAFRDDPSYLYLDNVAIVPTIVVVTNPGDQSNNEGDTVSLAIQATDASGGTLTYSATSLPTGLNINASSGLISGSISAGASASSPFTTTVTANDGTYSDDQTFTWNVSNPVTVNNPSNQSNYEGDAVSLQIQASDATGGTLAYSATGLPTGLNISASSGLISGTINAGAAASSPFATTVTASDGTYSDAQTFNWHVSNPVAVTNPGDQTNQEGNTVSLQIQASDATGGTLTYFTTNLPTGLSINASSGLISGTISAGAAASSPFATTVTASDGASSASQAFNWGVTGSPNGNNLISNGGFETGTFSGWTQGGNTGYTFVQSGSGNNSTYGAALGPIGSDGTLSQTIATNPGTGYQIRFDLQSDGRTPNDFTATFGDQTLYSGTDLVAFSYTTFTYDVTATGTSTTLQFAFRNDPGYVDLDNVEVVAPTAPSITSGDTTAFTVGQAGAFTVTSSGYPAASLSESGGLPAGVTFTDNGNGTANLAGTPAVGTGGTYTLTLTASNGVNPAATQSFTLTVNEAPSFTSSNATSFLVGHTGTFTVTTGHDFPTATTLSETGTLPGGVTFIDNHDGTATLTGTPNTGTGGTYSFTLTASNGVDPDATQSFTLTVKEPPSITSSNATAFLVGHTGTFTVTTGHDFPTATTLSESGTLPGGVTFTDNGNGTATLSGTPNTGTGGIFSLTLTASNGVNPDAMQSFTLTVNEAPSITSGNAATFIVGHAGTFTVTTTSDFPTATALSESGTLPGGVTFTDNDDGTATLAGTPSTGTGGTYSFTITASNGVSPDSTQSFTLTVNEAPSITSGNAATFIVGRAGTFTVTTGHDFPTATALSESGTLPGGVTFTDNDDGTATLAGTPNAGTGGIFTFTITASNGVNPDATQSFNLTVNEAPSITSGNATTFIVGHAGTFTVTTGHDFPTATTLSEAGSLVGGVTFIDNHNGTATLAGTPNTGTGGTYSFTITAANGVSPDATQSFTLTVNEAPSITSSNATTFTVGHAGTFTVTTGHDFPTASLMETGILPDGVTFTDNHDGTATLAGTPNASTGGTYAFTITASNGVVPHATQSFTLTLNEAPSLTSGSAATFTVGHAGTFTVTTGHDFPAATTLSETGTLPGGVTFTDSGDGTATLAGTPNTGTGGTYAFTITAANGITPDATQSFMLTVNEAPSITSSNATTFIAGHAGTFTVTTGHDFPTATILSESGTLPAGVTFTDNHDGTATLSGTPSAGTSGTFPFTITASNGIAPDAARIFTLTVNEPPSITSSNATTFTAGHAGTFTVTTGHDFPTASLMETGILPGGVTFTDNDDGTATLAGTPNIGTGGTYSFTITAANGVSPDATQSFTLTVNEAPSISSSNATTFIVGYAGTFTVTTGHDFPAATTLSEIGTLPSGVTFTVNHDGTATLGGTPISGTDGTYDFTITANNGVDPDAVQNFTLTVDTVLKLVTVDHSYQAFTNQTLTVSDPSQGVLSNDNDPDGDALTVTEYVQASSGSVVTINHDGTFSYNSGGFTGTDHFQVSITDGVVTVPKDVTIFVTNPVSITNPGAQYKNEGDTVSLQIHATDASGRTLSYSANGLPPGLTIDPDTGLISGSVPVGTVTGGPVVTTVIASNGASNNSATFTWNLTSPVSITNPGDQTTNEEDTISLQVHASDLTVASLTYAAIGLAPGLSINPSTGLISGIVAIGAAAGEPFVTTLIASDGIFSTDQTFNWNVNNPVAVTAPADQTNTEGDTVSLPISASDSLGRTIVYAATGLPSGLKVDPFTGVISGTISAGAAEEGPFVTTVTVNDGTDSDSQTFNWNVNPLVTVANPGDQTNSEGDTVSLQIQASDPGSSLTFSATGLPDNLTINATSGLISGTIDAGTADYGPFVTTVTASDGNHSDSQTFNWNVNSASQSSGNPTCNRNSNSALTVTSISDQNSTAGDTVSLQVSASDSSDGTLTYTAKGLPNDLTINAITGLISGTIGANAAADGPFVTTVTVSDGTYSSNQTFNWNVTSRIILASLDDQNNSEGDTVSLQVSASDAGGGAVNYAAADLPTGLTINAATGLITGTISAGSAASAPFITTVTASDGTYSDTQTFFWNVSAATPITVASVSDQNNREGDTISLPIAASDSSGGTLAYMASGLPYGLRIDAHTGVIFGVVAVNAAADSPFITTITATNGLYSASQTFTWYINSPITVASIDDQSNSEGDKVSLQIQASAASGDALSYAAVGLPSGLHFDAATGLISGTITTGTAADSPFVTTVTATDGIYSASQSFTWNVSDPSSSTGPGSQTTIDDVPEAFDGWYSTLQGQPLIVSAADGVLNNAFDAENDPLTASVVIGPTNGQLTLNTDGSFTYIPNPGFLGFDSFQYSASNGLADSDPAFVTLQIVDATPQAADETYTVSTTQPTTISADAGLLADASSDLDNPLTAVLVTPPGQGSVTVNDDGSFTYTPNAGMSGADQFSFEVTDGVNTSAVYQVTLTTGPAPATLPPAPVADDWSYNAVQNQTLRVSAADGVLSDATDFENYPLIADVTTYPANGTLSLNPDGSFTYRPDNGFTGPDSFQYSAGDGFASSVPATVTLQVSAAAPSTSDGQSFLNTFLPTGGAHYSINATQPTSIDAAHGLLVSVPASVGAPLTPVVVTPPSQGTVTVNNDGSFTYTPSAAGTGTDSFAYQLTDGHTTSATAVVSLSATPLAAALTYTTDSDTTLSVTATGGLLASSGDGPGAMQTAVQSGPQNGMLTLNADGSFTYQPNAGYAGADSFSYVVQNDTQSAAATVTLHVADTSGDQSGGSQLPADEDVQIDTWTGAGGNNYWNNPNNWDSGVPDAQSNVVINAPNTTVVVDGNQNNLTVQSLKLTAGTLNLNGHDLTVANLNWGGGTLTNGGVTLTGTSNIVGPVTLDTVGLTNNGSITWLGGTITGKNNGTFTNCGTFTIQGGTEWTSADPRAFVNDGTLVKDDAGMTTLSLDFQVNGIVAGPGTVNVEQGTLKLASPVATAPATPTMQSAQFLVEGASSTLEFSAGVQTLDAFSSITGSGTVVFSGGTVIHHGQYNVGTTNIMGGSVEFDDPGDGQYAVTGGGLLAAGNLSGTRTFSITDLFTWTGGTMLMPQGVQGTTRVEENAELDLQGGGFSPPRNFTTDASNRELVNWGTVRWTGAGGFDNRGLRAVENDNTFLAEGTGSLFEYLSGGFTNNGSFTYQPTQADATAILQPAFTNNGTVQVEAGTLQLINGSSTGGSFTVAADATLAFEAYTTDAESSIAGDGTVLFNGTGAFPANIQGSYAVNTTVIRGSTVSFNGTAQTVVAHLSSGVLAGAGTFTVTCELDWTGGKMSGQGATVIAAGASLTIDSEARLELTDQRQLDNQGQIQFTEGRIRGDGTAAINNSGTFIKAGDGTAELHKVAFNNYATVDVQDGTLSLGGGGSAESPLNISDTATLEFSGGTFDLNTSLDTPGTVEFGDGTVTVNCDLSAANLDITDGTVQLAANAQTPDGFMSGGTLAGTGTFTITSKFLWTGGRMQDGGTTVVQAGAELRIADAFASLSNGRTLDNEGTIRLLGSGGLFAAKDSTGTLENNNTFIAENGTVALGVVFTNHGSVIVQTAELILQGGGESLDGDFQIAADGILHFANNYTIDSTSAFINSDQAMLSFSAGTVTIDCAVAVQQINLDGGEADFSGFASVGSLLLSGGGVLSGGGTLTVTDTLDWVGGSMTGGGETDIAKGAHLFIFGRDWDNPQNNQSASNRIIVNKGDALCLDDSNLTFTGGVTFDNQGTFTALDNTTLTGTATDQFTNEGTFLRTGNGDRSGNTFFNVEFDNARGGVVRVQTGNLQLTSGTSAGLWDLTDTTTLTFAGSQLYVFNPYSDVTYSKIASAEGTPPGNRVMGVLVVNGQGDGGLSVQVSLYVDRLQLVSGTLTGPSNVTVGHDLLWSGGTMTGTGATVLEATAKLTLLPAGTNPSLTLNRQLSLSDAWQVAWLYGGGTIQVGSGDSVLTFTNQATMQGSSTLDGSTPRGINFPQVSVSKLAAAIGQVLNRQTAKVTIGGQVVTLTGLPDVRAQLLQLPAVVRAAVELAYRAGHQNQSLAAALQGSAQTQRALLNGRVEGPIATQFQDADKVDYLQMAVGFNLGFQAGLVSPVTDVVQLVGNLLVSPVQTFTAMFDGLKELWTNLLNVPNDAAPFVEQMLKALFPDFATAYTLYNNAQLPSYQGGYALGRGVGAIAAQVALAVGTFGAATGEVLGTKLGQWLSSFIWKAISKIPKPVLAVGRVVGQVAHYGWATVNLPFTVANKVEQLLIRGAVRGAESLAGKLAKPLEALLGRRLGVGQVLRLAGNNCFVAGTPLLTPDGEKLIEEFRKGDRVLSRHENDPAGLIEAKVVEEVFVRVGPVYNVRVNGRLLRTTREHLFYVWGCGWRCAGELLPGDQLCSADGQLVTVEAAWDSGEVTTVYNLRVADYHTYFVGSRAWGFSVWAHNAQYAVRNVGGTYQIIRESDGAVQATAQNLQELQQELNNLKLEPLPVNTPAQPVQPVLEALPSVGPNDKLNADAYIAKNQTVLQRPPVARRQSDVNIQQKRPVPPPAQIYVNGVNGVVKGPGGGYGGRPASGWQMNALRRDLKAAEEMGAKDIRIRQNQVNAAGVQVGTDKPDLQYTIIVDGQPRRVYIEYDDPRPPSAYRGFNHYDRILANDPTAIIILRGQ